MQLHPHTAHGANARLGIGLLEATIAISLLAVTVMATFSLLDSSRRFASASLEVAAVEDLVQDLVYDIERELGGAAIQSPASPLTTGLAPNETTSLELASSAAFPPTGSVVVDRGTPEEEVLSYENLGFGGRELQGLIRGLAGTADGNHASNGEDVLWRGLAELIDDQTAPPATAYDGQAQGEGKIDFFRGHGAGIVYRLPVDPDGDGSFFDDEGLQWGADLNEFGPTEDGYYALYFEPLDVYDESEFDFDLNGDQDEDDVFDIGQLRRVVWDASAPTRVSDVGVGPTAVLQEQGAWGSDLDGDGMDDPMFLHDPNGRTVHVRLHVIGRTDPRRPITRTVETILFLRNDPDA